jgi:hypothetical protein
MKFLFFMALTLATGCGLIPSPCEQLVTTACEECDITQSYEDTVCECVENGEVDNAQQYYSSKDAAEIACASTQDRLNSMYLTNDEVVECRRSLKIIKDFGDDGCEYLGLASSGNDDEYSTGYDYGNDGDGDGGGEE